MGFALGLTVGLDEGCDDACADGSALGLIVGLEEGFCVGGEVICTDGLGLDFGSLSLMSMAGSTLFRSLDSDSELLM